MYELCSYPPALFESPNFLRQAQKSTLADTIWSLTSTSSPEINAPNYNAAQYVLDGGALLQRISWKKGGTYQDVFITSCDYVKKKYGKAVVVFDGYTDVSTKCMTHQRREKKIGPTVAFTSQMPLTMNKVKFLANKVNKQKFIALLGQELEKASCTVYHASGDADVLIVQKAVQSAQTRETILIGVIRHHVYMALVKEISVSKLCHLIQHLHPSMILQLQVRMYWSAYTVGNQVKH